MLFYAQLYDFISKSKKTRTQIILIQDEKKQAHLSNQQFKID